MNSQISNDYLCPICGKPGEASARYPRYICVECGHRATDKHGRELYFRNESLSGGFLAFYRGTGEPYISHKCFVDGRACWADEAYMGGIVVSIYDASFNKE